MAKTLVDLVRSAEFRQPSRVNLVYVLALAGKPAARAARVSRQLSFFAVGRGESFVGTYVPKSWKLEYDPSGEATGDRVTRSVL